MKLKTVEIDGKTYAEVQDGKPVFVGDDGKDVAFDAPATVQTISRLNGEAKNHREAKEAAERALKSFEGISDPAAALKALQTVSSLDDKKLIDAGEVEKVKAEAIKAVEEKYAPVLKELETVKGELHSEKIGGAFSRSKFISEKLAIPADLAQARFGANFRLEEGKVVAFDQAGNKLYSKASPGELAGFDEAFEMLVDAYPYKDHILKGDVKGGGGAKETGGSAGGRTISRAEFDKLAPADQMKTATSGVQIVD